jgi:hypothetical protein
MDLTVRCCAAPPSPQCCAESEARQDAEAEVERLRAEAAFIKEAKVRGRRWVGCFRMYMLLWLSSRMDSTLSFSNSARNQ